MKTSKITTFCFGLAFVGSSLFLTNCKKDDKDPETDTTTTTPTPAATNTEKLTGKNFKMTAATIDPAIVGVTDWYAQMEDCQKDNLYRFDTPNVYKEDEGATKCATNDPQTLTGTWTWNTDETILTTKIGTDEAVSYTVITNDGTTLKIKYTQDIQGTKYTVTGTYVKQ